MSSSKDENTKIKLFPDFENKTDKPVCIEINVNNKYLDRKFDNNNKKSTKYIKESKGLEETTKEYEFKMLKCSDNIVGKIKIRKNLKITMDLWCNNEKRKLNKSKISIPENYSKESIVIILESPHIKEYSVENKINEEYVPAIGTTGSKLQEHFEEVFDSFKIDFLIESLNNKRFKRSLLKKDYDLILLNAIPYQCSLGLTPLVYRDNVFEKLWNCANIKEDFFSRIDKCNPIMIINLCTIGNKNKGLNEKVEASLLEHYKISKGILIAKGTHPSFWSVPKFEVINKNRKKLFIVGNGFDLAHNLPTSYEDFRQYLIKNYVKDTVDFEEVITPEPITSRYGEEYDITRELVPFILRVISNAEGEGEKWADFETSLGILDFADYTGSIPILLDRDYETDHWANAINHENVSKDLLNCCKHISAFFSEWVNGINVDMMVKPLSEFQSLFNNRRDLCLTFNYTMTLEKLYNAKNICHIHGMQNEEIIIGHGSEEGFDEDNGSIYINADYNQYLCKNNLRKDTSVAFNNNANFFEGLDTSITTIYSFGFSFSGVDMIYIKKICEKLATQNVTWYFNEFDYSKNLEAVVKSCGFKGVFDQYQIQQN